MISSTSKREKPNPTSRAHTFSASQNGGRVKEHDKPKEEIEDNTENKAEEETEDEEEVEIEAETGEKLEEQEVKQIIQD